MTDPVFAHLREPAPVWTVPWWHWLHTWTPWRDDDPDLSGRWQRRDWQAGPQVWQPLGPHIRQWRRCVICNLVRARITELAIRRAPDRTMAMYHQRMDELEQKKERMRNTPGRAVEKQERIQRAIG